ncbi:host specificity factor TipJ family phage tail protein [Micavibrio aeruginosavorus]|uniref:Phage-related protein, tail component n=1 Tax=Micavibrio aeruginosavorus EPB TaxID=349215 RepID=M4VHQ4_9BACT|nr:host specificity factor TipJ family phage tail protein [Micavibrio aeruginosavorus]AGH98932.1 Phage-related protein, tail component [Micavibrio aeruginosavorus EPB]
MAQIAIHYNPFYLHKDVDIFTPRIGQTIRGWLNERGIAEFSKPTLCLVDGEPVLRKDWAVVIFQKETVVSFITLPQGGGGGGKIFRAVLTIAIMVAAPYAGAALGAAMGVTSAVGVSLLTAGVALAGSVLVNALIPPPMPSSAISNYNATSPSPTYSIQAQGNSARLGEPIPVVYGRHVIYPDFGATPYSEFGGNEQYLYQLHVIGQGEYDIEQIRIEDTPITSFQEITYEIVPPGGMVTLLDTDVVTAAEIAGQELLALGDGGDWVGPFVANPTETTTDLLALDVVMPKGLYYANDNGSLASRTVSWEVQARLIDDEGNALGAWTTLAAESHTANTNTPIRLTYKYPVPAGRYEVQALRTNGKDNSARAGNDINWNALKAHLVGEADFGNVTLLAMKMRATDNLSQRSARMVNCIATRKLKSWHPDTGWSDLQPTRSIAWALADILKATYGAKLTDSRIDLMALVALDAVWTSRGDTFNGVFDRKLTVWDALTQVARCGRTLPFLQGGLVRFARDESRALPVAMFSPRNIVKGSFKIDFVMPGEDTADSVKVEFFNQKTWKQDEVIASLPDSAAEQPATVSLFGCTDKDQATREGMYMAAANRYRRRIVSFRTELEGMIPTYSDLIAISHDMPRWGEAGDVIDYAEPVLTLSEPVTFVDTGTHYVVLRRKDGSLSGPWTVSAGGSDYQLQLMEEIDFTPYTGTEEERTHFSFGVGEQWGVLARVLAVRPRGEIIEISAVVENSLVHTADQ